MNLLFGSCASLLVTLTFLSSAQGQTMKWLKDGRVPFPTSEGHDRFQLFLDACLQYRTGDKSKVSAPSKVFSKMPPEFLSAQNQTLQDAAKKYDPTLQNIDADNFYNDLCPWPIKPRPDEANRQKGIKDACGAIRDALPTGTVPNLPGPDSLWDKNSPMFAQIRAGNVTNSTSQITNPSLTTSATPTSTSTTTSTSIFSSVSTASPTDFTFLLQPTAAATLVTLTTIDQSVPTPAPLPPTGVSMVIVSNLDDPVLNSTTQGFNRNGGQNGIGTMTDAQRRAMHAMYVGLANSTGLNYEDELWGRITRDSENSFKSTLLDRLSQPWNDDQKSHFWRSFCAANRPKPVGGKKGKKGKGKRRGVEDDEGGSNALSAAHDSFTLSKSIYLLSTTLLGFAIAEWL